MRWQIWLIALAFGTWENIYFGWNAFPRSDTELMADGLTALIFALSFCKFA